MNITRLRERRDSREIYGIILEPTKPKLKLIVEPDNYKEVLKAVQKNGSALEFASKELQDNRNIVSQAVKKSGYAISFASERLQNDIDIVLLAIQQEPYVIEYVSKKLQNDKKIIFKVFEQYCNELEYASLIIPWLFDNKYFVLLSVTKKGNNLSLASERLKNDKEIVKKAIQNNGDAFEFASEQLKNDREFLIECYIDNNDFKKYDKTNFLKKFHNLENHIFDDNFIDSNYDILHLLSSKTTKKLYKYLFDKKKYNIIYKNENLHENIKIKKKIIILSLDDIDNYNDPIDKIKLEFQEKLKNFNLIFF
jgi:hypothetical protein